MGVPGFQNFLEGSPAFDPDGTELASHLNSLLTRIGARVLVLLEDDETVAGVNDLGKVYRLADHTLTLDTAFDLQAGWWIYVKGPGVVVADDADTLEGEASLELGEDSSALLVSDGESLIVKLEGGAGAGGVSLEPMGEWNVGTTYAKLDVVSLNGSSYISTIEGNVGSDPEGSPTNWQILAQKGETGSMGANGADGSDPGILFTFDDGTSDADPGAGNLRANNANFASAAFLYISKTNRLGDDVATFLLSVGDADNAARKGILVLTSTGDDMQSTFDVQGVTNASGYVKVAIDNQSGATAFTDVAAVSFQFTACGDDGSAGDGSGNVNSTGSPIVPGNIVQYADDSGNLIEDSGIVASEVLIDGDIGTTVQAHSSVLDATTASFTTSDETKLDGIEAAADVTDAGNVGSAIHGASGKTTPVDADTVPLIDSAASNVLKKVTWANVKATLKAYFDTLYPLLANTLDYEEGTWTPAFTATGGTFNYHADRAGVYRKVGALVTVNFWLRLANSGNTLPAASLGITGLPFNHLTTTALGLWAIGYFASTTSYVQLGLNAQSNSVGMAVSGITGAATTNQSSVLANAALHATNTSVFDAGFSYPTAT